jgi:nicotinate-nucleotide pyrophosphorylase (carboxylating)
MSKEIEEIRNIVKNALNEDITSGDITSDSIVFKERSATGEIIAKESGIVCGTEIAELVFKEIAADAKVEIVKQDGDNISGGDVVMRVESSPAVLLKAERTALNFLSHLSGIATLTSEYVHKVKVINQECAVLDTRKTLPGLRILEKYAVKTGGGRNHRFNLSDQVLIKENHLSLSGGSIKDTVAAIYEKVPPNILIELEVENMKQLKESIKTEVDIIMLDNFNLDDIYEAVKIVKAIKPSVKIEVSGGVTLETVSDFAATGVDRISVGRITNSAKAIDYTLLIKGIIRV